MYTIILITDKSNTLVIIAIGIVNIVDTINILRTDAKPVKSCR